MECRGPGWREEVAAFDSGGRRLVGVLSRPDPERDAAGPPAVVLHGWGSYRSGPHRCLVELARELASRGLSALRFDFSGRGDSAGDYWKVDLDAMVADAIAAADFLTEKTGADEVSAAGLCSGANVALGAATLDARFGRVAALSALPFQKQRRRAEGAKRAGSTLRELLHKGLRLDTYRRLFRGEVSVGRILRRLALGEGGRSARAADAARPGERRNLKDSKRDIQAELAVFSGRLFFAYGAADAEGLSGWRGVLGPFLAAHRIDHLQMEVPGADHDFHSLGAKRQVIEAAADFLAGTAS